MSDPTAEYAWVYDDPETGVGHYIAADGRAFEGPLGDPHPSTRTGREEA